MIRSIGSFACSAILVTCTLAANRDATATETQEVLKSAGDSRGLVVHLGCGDGQLTAKLGRDSRCLVHGLDTDPRNVADAKAHIRKLGVYGGISIDRQQGSLLPYVDNLVNLFVVSRAGRIPLAEILRATAPGGVIFSKQEDGSWAKTSKPWPDDIDQWTHFLYNASGNAVSHDTVVGPPRHFQWIAGPRWARSHDHLSSVSAMVSAGGRVFYIVDEAPTSSAAFPAKWSLVARDAFNGLLLWKRPIDHWEGHLRDFRSGPTELPRRLVALGQRVFVTLGYGEPVTALDAGTGETKTTYEGTDNALEIILHAGKLFVVVGDRVPDNVDGAAKPERPELVWHWWPIYMENQPRKHIVALDVKTGTTLWRKDDLETAQLMPTTLAAAGSQVFFQNPDRIFALDIANGTVRWRADRALNRRRPTWSAPTLVVHDNILLSADRSSAAPPPDLAESKQKDLWVVTSRGGHAPLGRLIAFDTRTGETLWDGECKEGYNSPVDVLVVDNLVWSGKLVTKKEPGITAALDVVTGEIQRRRSSDQSFFQIAMSHHRCYRNKATEQYLITGRDGIEFIDVSTGEGFGNAWVRGSCQLGIMPCNGLVYASQHSCACHIESKLNGFNALAPKRQSLEQNAKPPERLVRGVALGQVREVNRGRSADDWPTYRGDSARSGSTTLDVSARLEQAWETRLTKGKLSSVVIANDQLLVAEVDAHTVHALSATDGEPLWSFTAGGRIDSPPTIHQGAAIFGCADGWIYCLRAEDGRLAWKFRSADRDIRFTARGQLESICPLPGSVLVLDDLVYAVAGRTTYLDEGLKMFCLDVTTGALKGEYSLEAPALPDVLSYDGESIFLRHRRFTLDGKAEQANVPHLYSSAGFLDDSWWHRTYWQFGTSMGSGWGSWPNSGGRVPAGRLMVIAGDDIYGFGRLKQYHRNGSHVGLGHTQYVLYGCRRSEKPAAAGVKAKKRRGAPPAADYQYRWAQRLPLLGRAMVLCDTTLFVAGPPDLFVQAPEDVTDPYHIESRMPLLEQQEALAGKRGGLLQAVSTADGKMSAQYSLAAPPAWDSMAAAKGRLFFSTTTGSVVCMKALD